MEGGQGKCAHAAGNQLNIKVYKMWKLIFFPPNYSAVQATFLKEQI